MTQRRIPLIPTLVVLAAVAIMIRLGFWQLDRLGQKEAMLGRYAAAEQAGTEALWPRDAASIDAALYHHAALACTVTGPDAPISGRSARGEAGWAHVVPCTLADGTIAHVVLGWSSDPAPRAWSGGNVSGTIAPAGNDGARLIANPPLAGLAANARPDPNDIPNNHLSYAVQWFLFATTALVIYALALRKRLAATGGEG